MISPEATPRIFIATGKMCAGKTTLVGRLVRHNGFHLLNANTTRPKRDSDLRYEYNYLTDEQFDALDPTDRMWNAQHGSPSRYTLMRSVVKAAIADSAHFYTRPLAPKSVSGVVEEFGSDVVKVLYLPSPSPEELERRLAQRGQDVSEFTARIKDEADWDEFAQGDPGIKIAQGTTPQEVHLEALALMGLAQSPYLLQ